MAGHSKWANIKHRKAAQDAKRGKIFTKLIRELTVAARAGGSDVTTNPRLRAAVDKALSNNMTRDTIDRAIKRGAGELDGQVLEEITYEGYSAGGAAVLVECMSDNRNRTVSEVRHAFSKCGGNLGTDGSVAYLFNKLGVISYAAGEYQEGDILEPALEAGAEDIQMSDDVIEVLTDPDDFGQVKDALDSQNLCAERAEVTLVPMTKAELDEKSAAQLIRLVDMLEDLDDVQNVYTNAEIADEILQNI
ncbi:YebC/PmpR family DNA-binding transcriptional regulator [Gayadomonas joobiniege]|uniref:YebC/PmpR family DNA-binding transcriptional regulator n=1 Tax=Gayadomonas joobiniege TaxID=1234606 RepID=UPI00036B6D40|nr:YebC/PmpR family DNA-binding transcriptional regulator [Gayadomonas joobiniege]